ncbi:hypothetical protein KP509_32G050300 [Ceratopteris richardii]|uniref:Uncharacterized protein n=1 Tax=Ceratopteris richardii TaxID=49495 RepID=A0A8T2QTI1_CERRI|nr:hypothetical protein KP509_32G050300 [Ceratopteris richardii]
MPDTLRNSGDEQSVDDQYFPHPTKGITPDIGDSPGAAALVVEEDPKRDEVISRLSPLPDEFVIHAVPAEPSPVEPHSVLPLMASVVGISSDSTHTGESKSSEEVNNEVSSRQSSAEGPTPAYALVQSLGMASPVDVHGREGLITKTSPSSTATQSLDASDQSTGMFSPPPHAASLGEISENHTLIGGKSASEDISAEKLAPTECNTSLSTTEFPDASVQSVVDASATTHNNDMLVNVKPETGTSAEPEVTQIHDTLAMPDLGGNQVLSKLTSSSGEVGDRGVEPKVSAERMTTESSTASSCHPEDLGSAFLADHAAQPVLEKGFSECTENLVQGNKFSDNAFITTESVGEVNAEVVVRDPKKECRLPYVSDGGPSKVQEVYSLEVQLPNDIKVVEPTELFEVQEAEVQKVEANTCKSGMDPSSPACIDTESVSVGLGNAKVRELKFENSSIDSDCIVDEGHKTSKKEVVLPVDTSTEKFPSKEGDDQLRSEPSAVTKNDNTESISNQSSLDAPADENNTSLEGDDHRSSKPSSLTINDSTECFLNQQPSYASVSDASGAIQSSEYDGTQREGQEFIREGVEITAKIENSRSHLRQRFIIASIVVAVAGIAIVYIAKSHRH